MQKTLGWDMAIMGEIKAIIRCCDCGVEVPRHGRNHKRCADCTAALARARKRQEFQKLKADAARYAERKERVNAARRATRSARSG
jgi:hypothetical protein